MSICPATIDRTGQQPCLPTGALLAVCERLGQGHVMTPQPPDTGVFAMLVLTAIAIGLVAVIEFFAR
jgi:hypothetical protein